MRPGESHKWSAVLAIRARTVLASLRSEWPLVAFCACTASVALLYNLSTSPDVLYDEAAYTWAAQHVALGWHLTLGDRPLFVHPPLMFLLQACWLSLTGHASAPLASAIPVARLLSASFGVADVLLVAALAYRLALNAAPWRRRVVTGVVALLAALDPVLVRYDRQDVIEPFALCAGLLVLHAAWALRARGALAYVSITGLLGGLALLTNQITIFLVAVPPLFALIERNGPLIRRSLAALGIAIFFFLTFFLWAAELGLAGSFVGVQSATLQRLIGVVQITGLNMPGVSLVDALTRSVSQYSSSYILLALGLAAVIWCWTRKNSGSGNFLTAWLTASYAFGSYIVAVGTLNEQFFVYLLPASIVGSVMLADALMVGWRGRIARMRAGRRWERAARLPHVIGTVSCAGLVVLSGASWATNYSGISDGVVRISRWIATTLPRCAAVNASGDADKYSYLLGGRSLASYSVGAAALADGVHYFLLAPADAAEDSGNMTPALASWIRDHGRRQAIFPSQTYKTVQLWHVPASAYDPAADVVDISGGVYVNTVGSDCGGYTVTNGSLGAFYSAYQELGGKSMLGDPLSRLSRLGGGGAVQVFDGVVLADHAAAGSIVRALPIVARLARKSPAAYRRAGFPRARRHATATQRRGWLTNSAIRRAYLDGGPNSRGNYALAVQRYGRPLGRPSVLPGGKVAQPFAKIILETSLRGGRVHAVTATPAALAAGVLRIPARARDQQSPPPLPTGLVLGPAEPTSVKPFVLTLGAALLLYGLAIAMLAFRQRREKRTAAAAVAGRGSLATSLGAMTGRLARTRADSQPVSARRPLRVLVDGRVMQDRYHGIGRYTFELLCELSRREVDLIVLYRPDSGRLDVGELIAQPTVRAVASQLPVVSLRAQWELSRAVLAFGPDVVFVPYHLSTPLVHARVPVVSVIHDCVFERDAAIRGRSAFSLAYGAATRLAIRSAAVLAAPSEASRDDVRRFYGAEIPAAALLPHGVGAQFLSVTARPRLPRTDLPGPYILHVGARRPHKNQRVLVEALSALRASHPGLRLVLVGQTDPRFPDEVGELVETLGLGEHVRRYTHADDETLLDLYANAAVFAYPSQVEGFGMPVLEAMAAGLPVVASDAAAVQEVAGSAALIVPATVTGQWVQALHRVLSDEILAQDLRARARATACKYTWAQSAESTLAVLAGAARNAKRWKCDV